MTQLMHWPKLVCRPVPTERLEVVSPLIRALRDDNPQVRANIANVLSGIGESAKQAVPTLI